MCDDDCCDDCFDCDCCGGSKAACFIGVTIAIGILLTVILVPLSLKRVDFDEVGIQYDTVSRYMATETIREGLYNVGPSGSILKWKRTQRSIVLGDVPALTKDAITVTMDLQVLFTIQPANLRKLIDDWYDQSGHENFVQSLCQATIRDVASTYVARSFFLQRQDIQIAIQDELRNRFSNLTVYADVESVQVSDITLPLSVRDSLLQTTTAQQDIQNAASERATNVQAAEIQRRLALQEADLTLINAQRDVAVINQAAEQARIAETSKLAQRTDAFGNISQTLGRGGDFFVQSYLRYLVMRQNGQNTVVGLDENG